MPLTEAQRLAFLKGREKRMANIEKAKLEKAEMETLGKDIMEATNPPEKPKVVRKPRKTKESKEPVDVKIDIDLGTSVSDPPPPPPAEVKQEEPEPVPPVPVAVSQPTTTPVFDEDAIATKVVSMLLEKGIGLPARPETLKPKKPRVSKTKELQPPAPAPPTATFTWM